MGGREGAALAFYTFGGQWFRQSTNDIGEIGAILAQAVTSGFQNFHFIYFRLSALWGTCGSAAV